MVMHVLTNLNTKIECGVGSVDLIVIHYTKQVQQRAG